jgi:hypothetical protein
MTSVNVSRDANWHYEKFLDFARKEIASGGPDPHITMAAKLAESTSDPAWFVGCYTAPYVLATAEVINTRWSREKVIVNPNTFRWWVKSYWSSLPIRKERRVNGTGPEKLAEILISYAHWLDNTRLLALGDFESVYDQVSTAPHHGRYFGMKLYETLRLAMGGIPEMEDIRPKKGSLARRGLAFMFPHHDPKDDSLAGLRQANALSDGLRKTLGIGWFTVEVLLCNYRQAFAGKQYPGRAHDSELGHARHVMKGWPGELDLMPLRSALFPHEHLGEKQGWDNRRLELGKVMNEYDYVWSDLEFDYLKTKDFANPVRRT